MIGKAGPVGECRISLILYSEVLGFRKSIEESFSFSDTLVLITPPSPSSAFQRRWLAK